VGTCVAAAAAALTALAGCADDRPEDPSQDVPVASLPKPAEDWSRVLSEDFASIDPKIWTLKDDDYSGNEDSFLRARNCSIDRAGADGHSLRLQAEQETVRRWGRQWDYTSCYATTEGTWSVPAYFRAEVRAKVPMEQGMWAAPLWLRPADGSGGEIDVAETIGAEAADPRVHQTLHTDYGEDHAQVGSSFPFRELGDPDGTGWHTYTVEKVPGSITMWVDGVQTAHWSTGDPTWFNRWYDVPKRWDLRVNLQVGGEWGGPPDASTDWSRDRTAMLVDHVYVWRPTSVSPLALFPFTS
jgi:beta-glucanase (GH16 family)